MKYAVARVAAVLGVTAALTAPALAHSPIMSCFENEDATITCEAGYSDGASAANQSFAAYSLDGRLLFEDVFSENGDYTFEVPDAPGGYYLQFTGDEAHQVLVYDDEIYWLE